MDTWQKIFTINDPDLPLPLSYGWFDLIDDNFVFSYLPTQVTIEFSLGFASKLEYDGFDFFSVRYSDLVPSGALVNFFFKYSH